MSIGIRGGRIPTGFWDTDPKVSIVECAENYYMKSIEDHILNTRTYIQTTDFRIDKVIFNDPATIVLWRDGTKTIVKCQEGDTYSKELGLAMCISKKALGNKGNFNDIFKEWVYE